MNKFKYVIYLLSLMISSSMFTGCNTQSTQTSTVIESTQPEETVPSEEAVEEIPAEMPEESQESAPQNINEQSDINITQVSEAEIHFIDTGNSDAILIVSDGQTMLVDGGENDDETLVVNYIKNQGITDLEYVISTHAHADHVGGLDAVVSSFNVGKVFVANGDANTKVYRDFINAAIEKGLEPSVPLEDVEFPLGKAYFTVMNTNGGSDTNNQSLVVEFVNGEDKVLLMGDAETEVEDEIMSKVSQVDLLKLGHHGSKTSTSQAFLDKVNPTYGVITCGANNSYGHPHQQTMNKLEGIEIHRTDECGDIIFKSTGNGLVTDCPKGDLKAGTSKSESDDDLEEDKASSSQSAAGSGGNSSSSSGSSGSSASAGNTSSSSADISQPSAETSGTVYWTPNGKSYHTTKDCPTLSRSKTILSGTIAESGKNDPCDRCH